MTKQTNIICDRCSLPIIHSDERVAEQLAKDYPGMDICIDCDRSIQLAGEVARRSTLTGQSPGEVLKQWLEKYDG